jgi:hypothetical protein
VVGAPEDEQELELEQAAVPQGPRPSRSPTEGSAAVALAWEAGADGARRLLAYVAQEDQDLASVVDVAAGREIAALPLAGGPTQVLVLEDGRVAVSLRWANAVALSSWDADAGLVEIGRFATAAEPLGLATTKDGARLLVVAGLGRELASYPLASKTPALAASAVALPREPRSVLVVEDAAYVSHAIGSTLTRAEIEGGKPSLPESIALGVDGGPGNLDPRFFVNQTSSMARSGGRLLLPGVTVVPGADRPTQGYGMESPIQSTVRVVDDGAKRQLHASRALGDTELRECLTPRGIAAVSAEAVLVACAGADQVLMLDPRAHDPGMAQRARFDVPQGPTAVAADGEAKVAVVWSPTAERVSVLDLAGGTVSTLALSSRAEPRWSAEERQGAALFRDGREPRISLDGRTCESCHPGGRDDGLTWSTPVGPRQTLSLAGRVGDRSRVGWSGLDLEHHLRQTMRRLGGVGFERAADRNDLRALQAWLRVMPAPTPVGARPVLAPRSDDATLARGSAMFAAAGCASCHPGGGTDGERHDVGTGHVDEPSLKFLTPPLGGVGASGPYLHTGRYLSIEAMLEDDPGPMGARALPAEDRVALARFVEALPPAIRAPAASGPIQAPTTEPYVLPAPTGPFQKMLRALEQERADPRGGVDPVAIDVGALPTGDRAPLPSPTPYVSWIDPPMSPERVLEVAPMVAEWERDGVRVSKQTDAIEVAPSFVGAVALGDWAGARERLTTRHTFAPRGRFVTFQLERLDETERKGELRYRAMDGFLDVDERRIQLWKRLDVPVAPILGGRAVAGRVRCEACAGGLEELLVVYRSDWTLRDWTVPLRVGTAGSWATSILPFEAPGPETWEKRSEVLTLSATWASGEEEPSFLAWVARP